MGLGMRRPEGHDSVANLCIAKHLLVSDLPDVAGSAREYRSRRSHRKAFVILQRFCLPLILQR